MRCRYRVSLNLQVAFVSCNVSTGSSLHVFSICVYAHFRCWFNVRCCAWLPCHFCVHIHCRFRVPFNLVFDIVLVFI